MLFASVTLLALLPSAYALPVLNKLIPRTSRTTDDIFGDITEAQILQIAPSSSSCTTGGGVADECRTAAEVAPLINTAHKLFNITTKGEKAALVSLQAFESDGFKFDRNQAGTPGQGTRNEMNFPFIYKYALDTPEQKDAALALVSEETDLSMVPSETQNAVLALMLRDDLSFASAAWFLKRSAATSGTNCDQNIIDGLQAATEIGWEAFITKCVGTTVTAERKKMYDVALAALD